MLPMMALFRFKLSLILIGEVYVVSKYKLTLNCEYRSSTRA